MRRCIYNVRSGEMRCEEVEPEPEVSEVEVKTIDPDTIKTLAELVCWNLVDQGILQPEDCLGE